MTADEILNLARAYAGAAGVSLGTAGFHAAGNNQLFVRLDRGHTCTARSIERAAAWFAANWPAGVAWPADVPKPKVKAVA